MRNLQERRHGTRNTVVDARGSDSGHSPARDVLPPLTMARRPPRSKSSESLTRGAAPHEALRPSRGPDVQTTSAAKRGELWYCDAQDPEVREFGSTLRC